MLQRRLDDFKLVQLRKGPVHQHNGSDLNCFSIFAKEKSTSLFANSANFANPEVEISIVIGRKKKNSFVIFVLSKALKWNITKVFHL